MIVPHVITWFDLLIIALCSIVSVCFNMTTASRDSVLCRTYEFMLMFLKSKLLVNIRFPSRLSPRRRNDDLCVCHSDAGDSFTSKNWLKRTKITRNLLRVD